MEPSGFVLVTMSPLTMKSKFSGPRPVAFMLLLSFVLSALVARESFRPAFFAFSMKARTPGMGLRTP